MTPIMQTVLDQGKGNCMAACVATLLDLPIEQVPNFIAEETEQEGWFSLCNKWLSVRGLAMVMVEVRQPYKTFWTTNNVPFIMSCESPRSTPEQPKRHAVVMAYRNWDLVVLHDPYPDAEQRVTGDEEKYFAYFLTPATLGTGDGRTKE